MDIPDDSFFHPTFSPLRYMEVMGELQADPYNVEIILEQLLEDEDFKKLIWDAARYRADFSRLSELDEYDRKIGAFLRVFAAVALDRIARSLAEDTRFD